MFPRPHRLFKCKGKIRNSLTHFVLILFVLYFLFYCCMLFCLLHRCDITWTGMFLGFGAKIPPNGKVSHLFPLNGNPSHPFCAGVEDILKQYRIRLKNVELFGPTNFSPVINTTVTIARQFQNGKHYFVLLIITDGVISDMKLTKRAIINASSLPVSIIIVGVGDAVFDAMDELDSDDVRLSAEGRYAEQDIVQFVPLNKFLSRNGESIKSQADLAREVKISFFFHLYSYRAHK